MKKLRLFFRVLWAYLRNSWRSIGLCLLLPGLFVLLHALEGKPLAEIFYPLLLTASLLLVAFLTTFFRFAGRQLLLWQALAHVPPETKDLPLAQTPLEEGFRALAVAYAEQSRAQGEAVRQARQENEDYYTLWVHQIKTPISALRLMSQSEMPLDREQLRQELYKIEQYVEAALSYQRLQSLHQDLDLRPVPLHPLCCQAVKKLRPLFVHRKIRLQMEPFASTVLSDPKWLGLVLEQILTNALKYQPEGGCVTVSLQGSGLLSFTDEGIGIQAEDVPRVFERGFTGFVGRGHEKSTGIGLYLCKKVCDALGHRISLTSIQGQGTTVTLDLSRKGYEDF